MNTHPDRTIHRWSARFRDPPFERAFRQSVAGEERWRVIATMALAAVTAAAFVHADLFLFGTAPIFFLLFALRLIYVAASLLIIRKLQTGTSPAQLEIPLRIWVAGACALLLLVYTTRPAGHSMNAALDVLLLVCLYAVLPVHITVKAVTGAAYTAGMILAILLLRTELNPIEVNVLIFAYIAANLIGLFVSWRLERLERLHFLALCEEWDLQEELRREKLELEASNAELDAFSHTVAHDLKNPLSGLLGPADMLLNEAQAGTLDQTLITECAEIIADSAAAMHDIIQALLLLASVRRIQDVQLKPLDTAALIAAARNRCAALIETKHARIHAPAHWPPALGYAPWVEEVWFNYLSNALKYGGPAPEINLGYDMQDEHAVQFWIRDKGPGFTEAEAATLFTEFTRLQTGDVEGHGLGLSIVKRIVEKLGGQAGCHSGPGQGALFYFTLPAAPQVHP